LEEWACFIEFIVESKEGLADGLVMAPDIQEAHSKREIT
jgi:hypothetical protein